MKDPELVAMSGIYEILNDLDGGARRRVVSWLMDRFANGQASAQPTVQPQQLATAVPKGLVEEVETQHEGEADHAGTEEDLSATLAKANAATEDQRVLFVAWYLFSRMGFTTFKGLDISKRLKHMGHEVNNVTVCLERLKATKPAFIIQVSKGGKTKQARKTYAITDEGKKAAKAMLEPAHANDAK